MNRRSISKARARRPDVAHILAGLTALASAAACSSSSSSGADAAVVHGPPDAGGRDAASADANAHDARAVEGSAPSADATTDGAGSSDAPGDAGFLTVPLSGCNGAYAVPVTIGSEPFALLLDTGSSTLAVAKKGCSACSDAGIDAFYTPADAAAEGGPAVSAQYGLGVASTMSGWRGDVSESTVGVAGLTAPVNLVAMTSEDEILYDLACTNTSGPFRVAYQGLIGFGVDAVLTPGTTEFFDQIEQQGRVSNVFAIHLCQAGGTLWLGGYDPSATAGPVQYTPMGTNFGYTVDWTTVTLGGTTGDAGTSADAGTSITMPGSSAAAILDSGGQGIIIPDASFQAVSAAIQESPTFTSKFGAAWFSSTYIGPVTVPSANTRCVTLDETPAQVDAELPAFTLTLGATSPIEVSLTATESYLTYTYGGGTAVHYCQALMDSTAVGVADLTYLGDSLMLGHIVVYDRAGQRAGIAPSVPCTN